MSASGETSERKWLDDAIYDFVSIRSKSRGGGGVFEYEIFDFFSPVLSSSCKSHLSSECPTFGARERKVQSAMSQAAIRRLLANGRIGIAGERDAARRGGDGTEKVRLFKPITVLDALADVMM